MRYSRRSRLLLLVVTLTAIRNVYSAPNNIRPPTSIIFPDRLDDLRRHSAIQKCQNNATCKTGLLLASIPNACSATRQFDVNSPSVDPRTTRRACNPFAGEVVWPATGECVELLTQGPCPEGYWIKINLNDHQTVCARRPCETGQAFLSGRGCVSLKTTNACPSGQFLINNEHGNGYCDCQPGKAYHSPSKACYRVYSQGPCLPGEIYKVLDDYRSSRAQCIPNPCPRENMVKLDSKCHVNSRGTCYPLGEKGPCVTGVLAIDQVLLEPACFLESDSHTLFSRLHNQCPIGESIDESGTCRVPFRISDTRKCHRGSLRDQEGRCRGHFSPSSLEEGTSLCPNNMIMIGGACYRVSG